MQIDYSSIELNGCIKEVAESMYAKHKIRDKHVTIIHKDYKF